MDKIWSGQRLQKLIQDTVNQSRNYSGVPTSIVKGWWGYQVQEKQSWPLELHGMRESTDDVPYGFLLCSFCCDPQRVHLKTTFAQSSTCPCPITLKWWPSYHQKEKKRPSNTKFLHSIISTPLTYTHTCTHHSLQFICLSGSSPILPVQECPGVWILPLPVISCVT